MASASLLQVGGHTEETSARAKNFTISSDARAADRKMRMTPPRSSSLSPCDAHSRCTSRACTTRRLTVTGSFYHALNVLDLHTHTQICAQGDADTFSVGYTYTHTRIPVDNLNTFGTENKCDRECGKDLRAKSK